MGKSTESYRLEMETYLKQKYNENFVIGEMSRIREIGKSDVISASCCGEKYPLEAFDIKYYLDIRDKYGRDEIIRLLQNADVYDESAEKEKDDVEAYFADNYINILFQHQFDDKLNLPDGMAVCTKISTANYFPNAEDSGKDFEEYCRSDKYDVYSHHYLFVADRYSADDVKAFIDESIVNSEIRIQCVKVFYVDDVETARNDFYNNYQTSAIFFEDASYVKALTEYTYYDGTERNEMR